MTGMEEALEGAFRPTAERDAADAGDEDDAEDDSSAGSVGALVGSGRRSTCRESSRRWCGASAVTGARLRRSSAVMATMCTPVEEGRERAGKPVA
jgi:hypothetical protein